MDSLSRNSSWNPRLGIETQAGWYGMYMDLDGEGQKLHLSSLSVFEIISMVLIMLRRRSHSSMVLAAMFS